MKCCHATMNGILEQCKKKAVYICYKKPIYHYLLCSQHAKKFMECNFYLIAFNKYIINPYEKPEDRTKIKIVDCPSPSFSLTNLYEIYCGHSDMPSRDVNYENIKKLSNGEMVLL